MVEKTPELLVKHAAHHILKTFQSSFYKDEKHILKSDANKALQRKISNFSHNGLVALQEKHRWI